MRILHIAMIVSDIQQSADFYEGILGLRRDVRPDLGFSGIFYALDGGQQLHLMQIPNPYAACALPEHGGRDRHLAFGVDDIDEIAERLAQAGIGFTRSRSGRAAMFCRDPDGNVIELCEVA